MRIVGVDPGINGAIAILDDGALTHVSDFPTMKSRGRGIEINWPELASDMDLLLHDIHWAFIEQVQTRPGNGGASAFKFGYAAGGIRGMLAAYGIPVTLVAPSKWKAMMGLTSDKDYSRTRAVETWPDDHAMFKRKKDNNRAEAALIAFYGWKQKRPIS